MLVLGRNVDESVDLILADGRKLTVMVVRVGKLTGAVRLGFDVPADVTVLRSEVRNDNRQRLQKHAEAFEETR